MWAKSTVWARSTYILTLDNLLSKRMVGWVTTYSELSGQIPTMLGDMSPWEQHRAVSILLAESNTTLTYADPYSTKKLRPFHYKCGWTDQCKIFCPLRAMWWEQPDHSSPPPPSLPTWVLTGDFCEHLPVRVQESVEQARKVRLVLQETPCGKQSWGWFLGVLVFLLFCLLMDNKSHQNIPLQTIILFSGVYWSEKQA